MTENHNCSYQEGSLRCAYPGAISEGTTGQGPWFCRIHARDRGSLIASQVLRASQKWQPKPAVDDLSWLAENYPMRPGESRHDYNLRCRDYALSMLKGFKPKPMAGYSAPVRQREPGEDMVEL